jgi:hypothetical protein
VIEYGESNNQNATNCDLTSVFGGQPLLGKHVSGRQCGQRALCVMIGLRCIGRGGAVQQKTVLHPSNAAGRIARAGFASQFKTSSGSDRP